MNARDAMPGGGSLVVSAEEEPGTPPNNLKAGRYVRLSVSDSGEGMDEATLARAAEPFFTTKGQGKGTGLGLSMVHGLAAQSGGTLGLESKLGMGTTVSLWLPVAEDGAAAPTPTPDLHHEAAPLHRGLTILVVDDDPLVSMGTSAMLEDLGHATVEASSAAAALEILDSGQRFDLVVSDQAMPGMTGVELARLIFSSYPGLPVIIASGYSELPDDDGLPELLRMTKPFTQVQLQTTVRRALVVRPPAS